MDNFNAYRKTASVENLATPGIYGAVMYAPNSEIVSAGRRLESITISSGQEVFLFPGGILESAVMNTGYGWITPMGGTINKLVMSGTALTASSCTVRDVTITDGWINVSSGAFVSGVELRSGGTAFAMSSAVISGLVLSSGGRIRGQSGAEFYFTSTPEIGASMTDLTSAAMIQFPGGRMVLSGNVVVDNIPHYSGAVSSGHTLAVCAGGGTDHVLVYPGANAMVLASGRTSETIVHAAAEMHVYSGGTSYQDQATPGGTITLHDAAYGFQIGVAGTQPPFSSGGLLVVEDNANVSCAIIDSGGRLIVKSNGTTLFSSSCIGLEHVNVSGGTVTFFDV